MFDVQRSMLDVHLWEVIKEDSIFRLLYSAMADASDKAVYESILSTILFPNGSHPDGL